MFVDIGLKFYAFTTHLSDLKFSGKAQVRRATCTLSCDSSYYTCTCIIKLFLSIPILLVHVYMFACCDIFFNCDACYYHVYMYSFNAFVDKIANG